MKGYNMYCRKCGAQNTNEAKFCGNCGAALNQIENANGMQKKEIVPAKKKRKRMWATITAVAALVVIVISIIWAFKIVRQKKTEKVWQDYIAQADKYLEELDYEHAEDFYLNAIAIDPKQKEPYLKLADVYLAQEEYGKAAEILEQAKEAVVQTGSDFEMQEQDEEGSSEIDKKLQEIGERVEYTWVIEPTIEADDINYPVLLDNFKYSVNEMERQKDSRYAVIKKDDAYGLVGLDGTLTADIEYKRIFDYRGYWLELKEPQYDDIRDDELGFCYFDEREMRPELKLYSPNGDIGYYYYFNGLRNIYDDEPGYSHELKSAIPVRQSESAFSGEKEADELTEWIGQLPEKYAIYSDGKLATDFIYEECGSSSFGLLAVKKDGKWGYVDEEGNEVIPLEYDASWDRADPADEVIDNKEEFCYAVSDGYIPLVSDGKWELRDTEGRLVILPGVFDAIRPVYKGKCWVKKDGKWGIIHLEGDEMQHEELPEEERLAIMETAAGREMEEYISADMDHDGAEETIGISEYDRSKYDVWYCSSDGENCELIWENEDYWDEHVMQLLDVGDETHIALDFYNIMGTNKCYSIMALRDGSVSFLIRDKYGYLGMTEKGDIVLNVEGYDSLYDPTIDGTIGHTWKDTYLYYDGSVYKEYGASVISESDFLKYENSSKLKEAITLQLTKEDTRELRFSYFKRKNGIMHIQCDVYGESGMIEYRYYTVRYKGNILDEEPGEYNGGQMSAYFSDLEVTY